MSNKVPLYNQDRDSLMEMRKKSIKSDEELMKIRTDFLEQGKKIVYNDDNRISNAFQVLAEDFKEKNIKICDITDYDYQVFKTRLARSDFSRLFEFVMKYAKEVQNQEEENDLVVIIQADGFCLEFHSDYRPDMPRYVIKADEDDEYRAVSFEEVLIELPKKFPPREEWSNRELLRL